MSKIKRITGQTDRAMDGYKNLMIAVLTTQIKDYLNAPRATSRYKKAEIYIFSDMNESEEYVFGFKFICSYIGLDPTRLREKVKKYQKSS